VMRPALMFCAHVMRSRNPVRLAVTSSCAGAVHWTGHDRDRRSAQRRDPRRKKDDDQLRSQQSAYHAANLRFASQFRFTNSVRV
jgi:hypothetical protein